MFPTPGTFLKSVCFLSGSMPLQPCMCPSALFLNSTRGRSESNQCRDVDTQGESLRAAAQRSERSWVYWLVCARCVTGFALGGRGSLWHQMTSSLSMERTKSCMWENNRTTWDVRGRRTLFCVVLIKALATYFPTCFLWEHYSWIVWTFMFTWPVVILFI